jgi:hypothetical protein
MMRLTFYLLLCLLLISPSSVIENATDSLEATNKTKHPSVNDITSLIPNGWHVLEIVKGELVEAVGDLNNDGISDIVTVIEETSKTEEAPSRALIIAFGHKNKTYSLSIKAEKAILKSDEGGVWGDPFESVSIDRGSVLLSFYGGSIDRWYYLYRFRFQDNDWFLIGATLGNYYTGTTTQDNADEEDYNLLTGDYVIKIQDEQGKSNTTKGNRGRKQLTKLKEFDVASEVMQF